jgi:HlyD family secretion protein
VYVVTASRAGTLRVRKGPFLRGPAEQSVFVIRGGSAVRTSVKLGLSGAEHIEVLGGLEEGDTIVASDLSDFESLESIRLR